MTTSWSQLTTTDHAMRRASGRRRYNAERQARAAERRVEVRRLLREYGVFPPFLPHGIRQRIADELGVHRSTISRDFNNGLYNLPRPKAPSPLRRPNSTAEWIGELEPLGARLTVEDCDCEETDELQHKLGHVLRMVAEALDAADEGKLELSERQRALFVKVRDVLAGLL